METKMYIYYPTIFNELQVQDIVWTPLKKKEKKI